MISKMPTPAKTAGGRFKQAFTSLPNQGLAILALTLGNTAANLFRTQAIARLPMENPAALHAVDFLGNVGVISPVLGMLPGEFGQNVMLGARFNAVNATARAVVPPKYPAAKMIFGVDEFISVEALAEAIETAQEGAAPAEGQGAMMTPGSRFQRRGQGAMVSPGRKYQRAS